ncbi:MAG TPA: MarR family transcriptional regulator [Flavitalea sp.]|nr:MarR family transcriptional regulator [Flavitalea sp.]
MYFVSAAFARKVERLAVSSWKVVNLSPSLAYLLMLVIEEPGSQPTYIGRHLHLKPSTVTRFAEKLEERKLIIRTTEGKLTNIYPTPKGKELYPELKKCLQDFISRYDNLIEKKEGNKLLETMRRVADKIDH